MCLFEKACFICEGVKALTEFYRHPRMRDGHLNKCIACTKIGVRANRNDKLDYYRAFDRKRGRRGGTAPHKRANTVVGNAVRDGRLHKPDECSRCSAMGMRLHGHHDDYAKPLAVRWLCSGCHGDVHREINERRRAP